MDTKTILLVEDEPKLRGLLVDYLSFEGYQIIEAKNGHDAIRKFRSAKVDLILLDVMMPFIDGFEVCRTLRYESNVIIVLLTAKSLDEDKLYGYELGADDYITKPVSPNVLMAKIKVLLNRLEHRNGSDINKSESVMQARGIILKTSSNEVFINGEPILLSRKEYELLLFFLKNPNQTLSRDMLLDRVWGMDYDGDVRTVDTHMMRLRQKLLTEAKLLVTIKGFGYQLRVVNA
jgi:DNA-binding response OmpR family regulator